MTRDHDPAPTTPIGCDAARELIHRAHDGEGLASARDGLRAHLAVCGECRELDDDLRLIGAALRDTELLAFPAEDLDDLFARTVDATPARPVEPAAATELFETDTPEAGPPSGRSPTVIARIGRDPRPALGLLAAALALAFVIVPALRGPAPRGSDGLSAEEERTLADLRLALGYTSRVLASAETAADRLITDHAPSPFERVPIRFDRRSDTNKTTTQ